MNTIVQFDRITTPLGPMLLAADGEALTEEFERTPAFNWLNRRAKEFGFHLTYPRNNRFGVIYEPWHWTFRKAAQ